MTLANPFTIACTSVCGLATVDWQSLPKMLTGGMFGLNVCVEPVAPVRAYPVTWVARLSGTRRTPRDDPLAQVGKLTFTTRACRGRSAS